MILLVLVALVCLGSVQCSLLSRAKHLRKFSTDMSRFRNVKEALTRYAYTNRYLDPMSCQQLLEEFGQEIIKDEEKGGFNNRLFLVAVTQDNVAFVRNWIQLGLPPTITSWDNCNAWHCYWYVNPEMRNILKAAAIPKNKVETIHGMTPLWYLLKRNRYEAVQDLITSETFTDKDLPPEDLQKILQQIPKSIH